MRRGERPSEEDISWYRQALALETRLLDAGLAFEKSALGWGDDWAGEAEEKRAALRDMERRRRRIDAAAARRKTVLDLAGWATVATAALGLLLFVVIPLLLWILRGIISGIRALVAAAATSPVTLIPLVIVTAVFVAILSSDRMERENPAFPWVLRAATVLGVLTSIAGMIWAVHILSPLLEIFAALVP